MNLHEHFLPDPLPGTYTPVAYSLLLRLRQRYKGLARNVLGLVEPQVCQIRTRIPVASLQECSETPTMIQDVLRHAPTQGMGAHPLSERKVHLRGRSLQELVEVVRREIEEAPRARRACLQLKEPMNGAEFATCGFTASCARQNHRDTSILTPRECYNRSHAIHFHR
jgi:hypothetical protein